MMLTCCFLLLAFYVVRGASPGLLCGAATRRGVRTRQQDATVVHAFANGATFLAVFDGHDSAACAKLGAAELAPSLEALLPHTEAELSPDGVAAALTRALGDLDARAQLLSGGSTVVAAVLYEEHDSPASPPASLLVLAHVGDAAALLCLPSGEARRLTNDHSAEAERARLEASGGVVARSSPADRWRLNGELALSRAIGDAEYRRFGLISTPTVSVHRLDHNGSRIVLVSDGVLEAQTEAEACASLWEEGVRGARMQQNRNDRAVPLPGAPHTDDAVRRAAAEEDASVDDTTSGALGAVAVAAVERAIAAGSRDNVAAAFCLLSHATPLGGDGASHRHVSPPPPLPEHIPFPSIPPLPLSENSALARYILRSRAPVFVDDDHASEDDWWRHHGRGTALAVRATRASPSDADDAACAWDASDAAHGLVVSGSLASADTGYAAGLALPPAVGDGRMMLCAVRALLALPSPQPPFLPSPPVSLESPPVLVSPPHPPRWTVDDRAGGGHFGEVWHAHLAADPSSLFVLKRVKAAAPEAARRAAAREAHFGARLRASGGGGGGGPHHAARFVEAFTDDATGDSWLAFVDEGESLASRMYGAIKDKTRHAAAADTSTVVAVARPSEWWQAAKRSPAGRALLLSIFRGVLLGLAESHALGIAHRDIKPGNVLVSDPPPSIPGSNASAGGAVPRVRLCDFGSAVDEASLRAEALYGPHAPPGAAEETAAYAPPEALFGGRGWARAAPPRRPRPSLASFDAWSAGVLGLELLVAGTPRVFELPAREAESARRAAAAAGLDGASTSALALLRGMRAALCIAPPPPGRRRRRQAQQRTEQVVMAPASSVSGDSARQTTSADDADGGGEGLLSTAGCSEAALLDGLKARDPTGEGLPGGVWTLRLLRQLLAWEASDRPGAARAAQHAAFAGIVGGAEHGGGFECPGGGARVEWLDECA